MNQAEASRRRQLVAVLLGAALAVAVLVIAHGGSFASWFGALDPVSARGSCRSSDGPRPQCDLAKVYYPQGLELGNGPRAVFGFYYSPLFALFMQLLAQLPYAQARIVWLLVIGSAALFLLVAPIALGWLRSAADALVYGLLFASSLPVLHDLSWGQVSSLMAALVVGSFLAYERGLRVLGAGLLALATSIKFFPALFALHYLGRRDERWLLWYMAFTGLFLVGIPVLFLGPGGFVTFLASLSDNLTQIAEYTLRSPHTSFAANALTPASPAGIDHTSSWYRAALAIALLGAGAQLWMIARSGRHARTFLGAMLAFATIPFVVRSAWVHYFVFLPLMQAFVLREGRARPATPVTRALFTAAPLVSAVLTSYALFALVASPDAFYRAAMPFWATITLLPALYVAELRPAGEAR
jgi:hypothetical protein